MHYINRAKTILLKDPYNWRFWLLIAFLARLLVFIIEKRTINFNYTHIQGFWGIFDGDTNEYLTPIDNLIKNGSYDPDFRMPGYGVFYLPLALLFSKATAYNILILFQLLCSIVATYLLALTALQLFNKKIFFYATFLLYATTIYSFYADLFLLTDSLTASFLVISVYCFVSYFKNHNKWSLISSGGFLTGVIFLRPVFAPFLAFFLVILLATLIKQKRKVLMPVLFFISFFTICDGSWIFRNYLHYKRIIPLTKEVFYVKERMNYLNPVMDFGSTYGGRIEWWDPRTGAYWLMHNDTIAFDLKDTIFVLSRDTVFNGKRIPKERGIPIPTDVYTSKFNLDTLIKIRKQIIKYRSQANLPETGQSRLLDTIDKKLYTYVQSVKDEKPLSFHAKAKWNLLQEFLSEITYEIPYIKYTYKFYHVFIILILALGMMGILLMLGQGFRLSIQFMVALIPLFVLVIHPLVLGLTIGRYFNPAFPFILVCAIYTVVWLKEKFIVLKR